MSILYKKLKGPLPIRKWPFLLPVGALLAKSPATLPVLLTLLNTTVVYIFGNISK